MGVGVSGKGVGMGGDEVGPKQSEFLDRAHGTKVSPRRWG